MPPAVPMAMMPKAATVNLLDQRGRLCRWQCHAANGCRCCRARHKPEPEGAGQCGEQNCLPHICLFPYRTQGRRFARPSIYICTVSLVRPTTLTGYEQQRAPKLAPRQCHGGPVADAKMRIR
jgi:hypothetical protein